MGRQKDDGKLFHDHAGNDYGVTWFGGNHTEMRDGSEEIAACKRQAKFKKTYSRLDTVTSSASPNTFFVIDDCQSKTGLC